eukprot:10326088-Alexandrium_andersonii.AAC.1
MPLNHVPGQGGACAVAAARTLRVVPGWPGPAAGRGWSCVPPAGRTIPHCPVCRQVADPCPRTMQPAPGPRPTRGVLRAAGPALGPLAPG